MDTSVTAADRGLKIGRFRQLIKAVFSEENYVPPNHLPLSATLEIMVFSYGDHLSNNILWAEMSLTEMVMGRNDPEPLYNMSRDVRKQTLCISKNKEAKPISVFVFTKWIVQSLYFLNLKFQSTF